MKIDLDVLRGSYDLRDYASSYLGEAEHSHDFDQYLCPFHQDDRPSFTVYEDHYYCFGCQLHGSIIDFVMEYFGKSFNEAVEDLSGNVPLVPRPPRPVSPPTPKKPSISMSIVEQNFTHLNDGLPYYHQRQITDGTSYQKMLGVKPDFATAYKKLDGEKVWFNAKRYALPNVFAGQVRAINYRRDDQNFIEVFYQHPCFFEVMDDLHKRLDRIVNNADIIKYCGGPKYRQEEGSVWRVFNAQIVAEVRDGKQFPRFQPYVLIHAEAKEIDSLALMDQGYPTTGITLSAALIPMLPRIYEHIPLLYIIRDADEAGLLKAETLAAALGRGRIITPPEGHKDTGEVIQAGLAHRWMSQYGLEPILGG